MAAGELRQRSEATIDHLTGLLNRRGLTDRLDELSKQATVIADGTPLALVTADLDHFKQINDAFGHARGDDVLRDVAYLIRKALRRFELAYRTGGEEFLVVLPGHDVATATALAESIRVAVENGKPGGVDITISLGVAVRPAAGVDVTAILEDADAAVYAAKRNGRNRVETARDDPTTAHMEPPGGGALASPHLTGTSAATGTSRSFDARRPPRPTGTGCQLAGSPTVSPARRPEDVARPA